jgi:hypothetical protein
MDAHIPEGRRLTALFYPLYVVSRMEYVRYVVGAWRSL